MYIYTDSMAETALITKYNDTFIIRTVIITSFHLDAHALIDSNLMLKLRSFQVLR